MKTRNATRTRQKLLTAATRLFAQKGFDGTSVDEIVSAARVNKRMVYHYFGSKVAIYREVLKVVFSRLAQIELAVLDPQHEPEVVIESLVRANFKFLSENDEFVQLLLWENLSHGAHIGPTMDELSKAPILELLQGVIKDGVASGKIYPGLKTKHLLIQLIGLCLIYFSNRYTLSRTVNMDLKSPKVLEQGIEQVIVLVKRGILNHQKDS